MKILISGGGGFIGRRLARALLSKGHHVRVLDNFALCARECLLSDKIRPDIIEADIRDYSAVRQALRGIDLVYHLAAPSSFLMYDENPLDCANVTVQGFINILEGMREEGIKRIIYTSTSAVYEGNPLPYTEDMKIDPPDLKALTKKFNEEVARQYFNRYGIMSLGLRPFSVFGYGEETKEGYANVISLFSWAMLKGQRPVVWGDGTQTRDFIFVDDVVEILLRAKEVDFKDEVVNVGTGKETSFNEVIGIINSTISLSLEPVYVPIPIKIYAKRLLADITKQKAIFGFEPSIDVNDGIAKTIEYIRLIKDADELKMHQLYFSKMQVK